MSLVNLLKGYFLGARNTKIFPKAQYEFLEQVATTVDSITDGGSSFDTITESTSGAGVTVDGVLLKDSTVLTGAGAVGTPSVQVGSADTGLYQISATQTGFTQDGVLQGGFDSLGMFTGVINEQVVGAGVVIDDLTVKDGNFVFATGDFTQITSEITPVAVTTLVGTVTTVALTTAADTSFSFNITSTAIVPGALIFAVVSTYAGAGNLVLERATTAALGGSATLTLRNVNGAAALNDVAKISYIIFGV